MAFAPPPVSRDGFYYNGDLYVQVGNFNRHKRASVPEIAAILRPDIRKSKTKTSALPAAPYKDPVGHWYEAQLIHYGLPPSKDKARAKIRLLEALNASTLVVPVHIALLKASLKKEYEAAERKAKAQYKAGFASPAAGKDPSESSKKRKNSDSATAPHTGSTVNVNINLGLYGGGLYNRDGIQYGGGSARNHQPEEEASPASKRAKLARENTTKVLWGSKNEPAVNYEPVIKTEPKSATSVENPEPRPTTTSVVDHLPLPTLGLINGYYTISCPMIESDFDCAGFSLILCLDTPRVWGAYEFGPFTGILRLPQRPFYASDEHTLPFYWRGVDHAARTVAGGEYCVGEMAFLGQGRIAGRLNIYGDGDGNCEFTGVRQGAGMGMNFPPRSAYSMRQEWESYI